MTKFIIKKSDIVHNCSEVMSKTHSLVIPVLKANCYGLGAKKVMEILHAECGINLFAVSRLEEARELIDSGVEILLLSCYNSQKAIDEIVQKGITCAVDSLAQAKAIADTAKQMQKAAKVHIKIDTGFGRFGFMPQNLYEIKEVYTLEGLNVCGIFSHFSAAFASTSATDKQFDKFTELVSELKESGIDVGLRHISNSSAFVKSDKYHLDAVRIGSLILGRLPTKHSLNLKKVGSLQTQIADIRFLKKGSNIGYGNVYRLKKDTRVAVFCVGSKDGVLIKKDYDTFRFLDILRYGFGVFKMLFKDNSIRIKIGQSYVKSVGRVALTHTMADVTGIDCKAGDVAEFNISPLYIADNVEREYI